MCGIAGAVNFPDSVIADGRVAAMRGRLRHRGPDGEGLWRNGHAILAHTRLAVIGRESGAQPMCSEDGSVILVCNGEIYNYRELTAELTAKGHRFATDSDSEVIIHLYEDHPDDFPKYLNGMFAFALYDTGRRRLLLGRDRIGQKPLFFRQEGAALYFASELDALRNGAHAALDPEGILAFFALQYIPPPGTIFLGIRQLLPANLLTFDLDGCELRCHRYWKADYARKSDLTADGAAAELREKLTAAVRRRLMAEVPLGGFLSGGLDSAVVAALMLECRPEPLRLLSVRFSDREYDESPGIVDTVNFLSSRHPGRIEHVMLDGDCESFDFLAETAGLFGQPFGDASMLPCRMLSSMTRSAGVTVTLSGDGADELFGGYERYGALALAGRLGRFRRAAGWCAKLLPDGGERSFAGRMRRFAGVVAEPEDRRYFALMSHGFPESVPAVFGSRLRGELRDDPAETLLRWSPLLSSSDPVERMAELDLCTYLPGDVLTKVDIASMHSAQEVRSPFLDRDVVELAARLPWRFKQCGAGRKLILKKAFADIIPPRLLSAGKRGFGVPVARLLRTAWHRRALELTSGGVAVELGYFDRDETLKMWERHDSGRRDESRTLFNLLIFELFLRSLN
ncbi:MAG: asparagine synthase (glutamine-hydrolyzing) [Victivallaceae bacterium]|nr:asparagine synthase (glutamine-hydrolyzing) [Victivallaceae bacterium]